MLIIIFAAMLIAADGVRLRIFNTDCFAAAVAIDDAYASLLLSPFFAIYFSLLSLFFHAATILPYATCYYMTTRRYAIFRARARRDLYAAATAYRLRLPFSPCFHDARCRHAAVDYAI